MIETKDFAAALARATATSQSGVGSATLLASALDKLTIGRAHHGLALAKVGALNTSDDACIARDYLNAAIDGLSASGQNDQMPLALLARAAFCRSIGDWHAAQRDLDEVEEIAEPGPMRLFLCDMEFESVRLSIARIAAFAPLNGMLDVCPPKPVAPNAAESARLTEEARANLNEARKVVIDCGYHRRDEELAELEAVLLGSLRFADLPPRA